MSDLTCILVPSIDKQSVTEMSSAIGAALGRGGVGDLAQLPSGCRGDG